MTLRKLITPGINPGGVDKLYGEDWNRLVDSLTGSIAEAITVRGDLIKASDDNALVQILSASASYFGGLRVRGQDTWDILVMAAAGAPAGGLKFRDTDTGATISFDRNGNVGIPATKRLYLDADGNGVGGDTYLAEGAGNRIDMATGGVIRAQVDANLNLRNAAAVQVLDGTGGGLGILMQQDALTSAGQRDSHYIQYRARTYDTASHSADWYHFVDAVTNSGGSIFRMQSRVDSGSVATRLSVHDDGTLEPAGNVRVGATRKLFLDGGGDTYIYESGANLLDIYVGGVQMAQVSSTHWDFNQKIIRNPKNSANTAVSGTPRTVEMDIGGTPYYFLVYPASS